VAPPNWRGEQQSDRHGAGLDYPGMNFYCRLTSFAECLRCSWPAGGAGARACCRRLARETGMLSVARDDVAARPQPRILIRPMANCRAATIQNATGPERLSGAGPAQASSPKIQLAGRSRSVSSHGRIN